MGEMRTRRITLFQSLFNLTGIHGKILGIAVMLVVLLGLWLSWQVRQSTLDVMRRQLNNQGLVLGQNLAQTSLDYIFTDNIYALYRLMNHTAKDDPNIRYIVFLDPEGQVLVSTFGENLPAGLRDSNPLDKGAPFSIQMVRTEEGLIHDVAVPIFEGRAGVVRLGMSERGLQQEIANLLWRLGISTLSIVLLGVVLAYFLAHLITRPLQDLVLVSKDVATGALDRRSRWDWMGDEIGQLARAFNVMVSNLENSQRELHQKEENRRRLLGKVISAQEEERKRVARELHDQTAQSLTGLLIGLRMLEVAEGKEVKSRIEDLRQLVNDTLDDLRRLALELRPSILDDLGLKMALGRYVEDFSLRYRIDVELYWGQFSSLCLRSETEIAVFRMVQEALTNVAKHAGASNASIILERQEEKLFIVIKDNGRGFQVDEVLGRPLQESGLGLFGLMERAELLGGSMTIESYPNEGTVLSIQLPLEEVNANGGKDNIVTC